MVCRLSIILSVSATLALPQALVQYGAAAAGGAGAGIAGKPVSDGVDKIFGKLTATAQRPSPSDDAAEEERKKTKGYVEKVAAQPVQPDSYGVAGASLQVRAKERVGDQTTVGQFVETQPVAPPPPPVSIAPPSRAPTVEAAVYHPIVSPMSVVSPETLQALELGTARSVVIAKLGTPYSRIVIPEENSTREIYRYRSGGAFVGTVELLDGIVTITKPAER